MTTSNETRAIELRGVGPVYAGRLEERGIFTVFDVVAAPMDVLADVAGSVAEARTWRNMATFLQVDGMSPEFAELLARAGVGSLEELSSRRMSDLAGVLFPNPGGASLPSVDTDLIGRMLADATQIRCSLTLHVELREEDGTPVHGASVRVGRLRQSVDERGRARVLRIPPGQVHRVWVDGSAGESRLIDGLTPSSDAGVQGIRRVRIRAFPVANSLSEYSGDTLPIVGDESVSVETRGESDLREGDLLRVLHLRDSGEAILVSMLRDYLAGRLRVVQFRVSRAILPADAVLHSYAVWSRGALRSWKPSPARVDLYRRAQQIRHHFPAPSATDEERLQALRTWFAKAIEVRLFSRGGRR